MDLALLVLWVVVGLTLSAHGTPKLAGVGPGAWSLDNALDIHLTGAGWALGALGAGLLGGLSAVVHGRLESSRSADRGQAHAA